MQSDISPFVLLPSQTAESSSNSIILTNTRFSVQLNRFPALCQVETTTPHSLSSSITLAASKIEHTTLSHGDSVLLNLEHPSHSGCSLNELQSTLASVSLTNVSTQRTQIQPTKISLSQTMTNCDVTSCPNHLSGSSIRDINLGGSLLAQNTTFSKIRTSTPTLTVPSVSDPSSSQYVDEKYDSSTQRFTLPNDHHAAFVRCSFAEMSLTSTSELGEVPCAIHVTDSVASFLLHTCTFHSIAVSLPTTSRHHGAVYVRFIPDQGGIVNIIDTTFTSCTTTGFGGGMGVCRSTECVVSGCEFEGCQSGWNAGALFLLHIPNVVVSSSKFTACHATLEQDLSSGSSDAERNEEDVGDEEEEECDPETEVCDPSVACDEAKGGAVHICLADTATLVDVVCADCTASTGGGGINLKQGSKGIYELTRCEFYDCRSETDGGGLMALTGRSITITEMVAERCEAAFSGGGACLSYISTVTINDVNCTACSTTSPGRPNQMGGGIHIQFFQVSSVTTGLFTDCSATHSGGGLRFHAGSTFSVKEVKFVGCTCEINGGGLHGYIFDVSGKVDDCSFVNCTAKGNAGGCVFGNLPLLTYSRVSFENCSSSTHTGGLRVSEVTEVIITGANFVSCSALSYGGGLVVNTSQRITLSAVAVLGCSAVETGGGIHITLEPNANANDLTLTGMEFGGEAGNKPNACPNGFNLYYRLQPSMDNKTYLTPLHSAFFGSKPLNDCEFSDEEIRSVEFSFLAQHVGSILYVFHPYSGGELALDSKNGFDHELCGNTYLPCQTLPLSTTIAGNAADGVVNLRAPVSLEADLTITTTVKWTSDSEQQSITQSADKSIIVNSGTLTATSLSFQVSCESYSKSFFIVAGGSLSLTACSFDTISSSSPVIHATLTPSNTLSITKTNEADATTFKSCSSSPSALVFLKLTAILEGQSWNFDLSGLSFPVAPASNSGSSSQRIYVQGSLFATSIIPTRFPTVTKDDELLLWGSDASTDVSSSLLVYLVPIGSTVSVGGDTAAQIKHCGHFGVSCPTIQSGRARLSGQAAPLKVSINGTTELATAESLSTDISLAIEGNGSVQTITTQSTGAFEVTDGVLVLNTLQFTGNTRTTPFIIVSSKGRMSITSCTFSAFSSSSSPPVISATLSDPSSALTLSSVSFQSCHSIKMSGIVFIRLGAGTLTFTSPTFTPRSAEDGSNIYATASSSNLNSATLSVLSSLSPATPSNGASFSAIERSNIEVGKEVDGSVVHVGSVLFFFHSYASGDLALDSVNGVDHTMCGHSYLPCPGVRHCAHGAQLFCAQDVAAVQIPFSCILNLL